jgi:hypothetical protein
VLWELRIKRNLLILLMMVNLGLLFSSLSLSALRPPIRVLCLLCVFWSLVLPIQHYRGEVSVNKFLTTSPPTFRRRIVIENFNNAGNNKGLPLSRSFPITAAGRHQIIIIHPFIAHCAALNICSYCCCSCASIITYTYPV